MHDAIAAVSLTWSKSDISAISFFDVDEGTYDKLASITSISELI